MKELPRSLHFVGVGGIGMSGLAQMARSLGCRVTGSDRAVDKPENAALFQALRAQGIELYAQDGSRFAAGNPPPDALVYSTAIEEDNPDFKAAGPLPRLHRSAALALEVAALHCRHTVAVTGTCGKTSVSAWLAEALFRLGKDPGVLTGGLVNAFRQPDAAGNFRRGSGGYFVLEADESDKSLLNYGADSALILNIGTDHYPKEEVARVFGAFLKGIREFAVIELEAYREIVRHHGPLPEKLRIALFTGEADAPETEDGHPVYQLTALEADRGVFHAKFREASAPVRLPGPGRHQALNALALFAELRELGIDPSEALSALEDFHGVWRRFDPAGVNRHGVRFFDDYAHNVEKIVSCLQAGRMVASGRLIALFQPHGFAPLGFMREELFAALEKNLGPEDIFGLLPVYYAGGTSSFKPQSSEVAADWRSRGKRHYEYLPDRDSALELVRSSARSGDVVLVMGARDNSLSPWAASLAERSDKE
ncbi:MAG: hypothetical protein J5806_13240 [Lentisphaeria bacterium]|nr:hypothetical protein [Lentisphaeria bacterium]